MKKVYKTAKENFEDSLNMARGMTVRNIKIALNQRNAYHSWHVRALEQALQEKQISTPVPHASQT